MKVRETCGPAQSVATVPVKSCPFWNKCRSSLSLSPHFLSSLFPSLASLQEESLTYEGLLDSLEAEILKARQERQNMQATYDAAQLSKETAKVIRTSRHACEGVRRMIRSPLLLLLMIQVKWVTSRPATAAFRCLFTCVYSHYKFTVVILKCILTHWVIFFVSNLSSLHFHHSLPPFFLPGWVTATGRTALQGAQGERAHYSHPQERGGGAQGPGWKSW